jgi:hypothetical protein
MSRSARPPDKGPPDYLSKLDPWFVELTRLLREPPKAPAPNPEVSDVNEADANRGVSRLPHWQIPVAALAEWPRTLGELYDLLSKFPDPRVAQICSAIKEKLSQEMLGLDLNDQLLNVLSLLRFQTRFKALQESERQGDSKASKQVVEVMNLNNSWLHGQLPRGGVWFRTNPLHNLLMMYGLSGGLEGLTSSALVRFFDENCPCGETHDQQVLQRLRAKLQDRMSPIS